MKIKSWNAFISCKEFLLTLFVTANSVKIGAWYSLLNENEVMEKTISIYGNQSVRLDVVGRRFLLFEFYFFINFLKYLPELVVISIVNIPVAKLDKSNCSKLL